ncbi:MAG: cytochrome c oxidase accessory protein CcoG [Bdellovibrionales bacterium]|nr:cytochrome c oxidase accessory protein CcoG [Bdellovibrionales bacterium]
MESPSQNTRLSTIDASGNRLWVYPSDVSGRYRNRRTWVSGLLLLVFLLLPWLRMGGHQAVLFDIWNGRFSVFGLRFWSHDAPILLFLIAGAAVSLALVTSIWGRLWCGWACPQTVFVDLVFRRIERWIEGDAVRRRQLDQGPWNEDKVSKKIFKWVAYFFVALIISHSFVAYFIGTEKLAIMISRSPGENLGTFTAMSIMTAAVLFDFGWFREQFCTLLCPYGRFQSVLMDQRSLAIVYDSKRGEPRRGAAAAQKQNQGDCIDCEKCVHVCPTGIDIRNGLQMECIACTACADACDGVMEKIGKPVGLVRYSSVQEKGLKRFARPGAYFLVLCVLISGLYFVLAKREPVELTLIRKVGAPYEEVLRPGQEKEIVNSFKLDLLNQTFETIEVEFAQPGPGVPIGLQWVSSGLPAKLAAGESRRIDLFVRFPVSQVKMGSGKAVLETVTNSPALPVASVQKQEVPLVGPLR